MIRHKVHTAVGILLLICLIGATACDKKPTVVMPDVNGKSLNIALEEIKSSGVKQDPEVEGGGLLGVVNEANWTVCSQTPPAGEPVTTTPRLQVARSCPGSTEPTEASTSPAASHSSPEEAPSAAPDEVLTIENSPELSAVLQEPDYCSNKIADFAEKHHGQLISFDGSISDLQNHGNQKTRYDILLAPGDSGPQSTTGPAFQFRDVNTVSDLHYTNENPKEFLEEGDKLRLTARIVEYEQESCLFLLKPVATEFR